MKIILIIFLSFVLISCSKKDEQKLSAPIQLLCKGMQYIHYETNKERPPEYKSTITSTYLFKQSEVLKDNSWTIYENGGGSDPTNLNYEYLDQAGKPKSIQIFSINEQVIKFTSRFWKRIDEQNDWGMSHSREIEINRISGDWRVQESTENKWKDGSWKNEKRLISGTCENASQKF
jgi:hypothetical protein